MNVWDALFGVGRFLVVLVGGAGLFFTIAAIGNEFIQRRVDDRLNKRIEQEWVRSQHPAVTSKWDGPRG